MITKFMLNAARWAQETQYAHYNFGYTDNWARVEFGWLTPGQQWATFDIHTGEIRKGSAGFPYASLEAYLAKPIYLANAFSLQMLDMSGDSFSKISNIEIHEVEELPLNLDSAIGHQDTANVLRMPMNRVNITLTKGDTLYVAQLQGGRLPEGATRLPEGFTFKYYCLKV